MFLTSHSNLRLSVIGIFSALRTGKKAIKDEITVATMPEPIIVGTFHILRKSDVTRKPMPPPPITSTIALKSRPYFTIG